MPKRFYWDSCVFIDRIARKASVIAELEQITDAAAKGDVVIIASTLCIAECFKIKESGDSLAVQRQLINDFFDNQWIELVQINSIIAEDAQEISRIHNIKPPDAIHIATAIRAMPIKCTRTTTASDILHLNSDGKIGNPPLEIVKPKLLDPQLLLNLSSDAGEPAPIERPGRQLIRKSKEGGETAATKPAR